MSSYPHPDAAHVPPNTLAVTIAPPDTVTSTHMLTGTSTSPLPPSQRVHTHACAHTHTHMSTRTFTHHHSKHRRRGRMSLRWLCPSHLTLFFPLPPRPFFSTAATSPNSKHLQESVGNPEAGGLVPAHPQTVRTSSAQAICPGLHLTPASCPAHATPWPPPSGCPPAVLSPHALALLAVVTT